MSYFSAITQTYSVLRTTLIFIRQESLTHFKFLLFENHLLSTQCLGRWIGYDKVEMVAILYVCFYVKRGSNLISLHPDVLINVTWKGTRCFNRRWKWWRGEGESHSLADINVYWSGWRWIPTFLFLVFWTECVLYCSNVRWVGFGSAIDNVRGICWDNTMYDVQKCHTAPHLGINTVLPLVLFLKKCPCCQFPMDGNSMNPTVPQRVDVIVLMWESTGSCGWNEKRNWMMGRTWWMYMVYKGPAFGSRYGQEACFFSAIVTMAGYLHGKPIPNSGESMFLFCSFNPLHEYFYLLWCFFDGLVYILGERTGT